MGNGKYNFNRQTDFVTWLRAFAVISILLCHYVQESANAYIQMSAQLFNIGVNIFFLISGFCFGLQGEIKDTFNWYKKRLKRIYIPLWIFLIFLMLTYIVLRLKFNIGNLLTCFLGIQGAKVGVLGADHTWFITVILLCYLVTPLIAKQEWKKGWFFLGLLPIVFAFVPNPSVYTLLDPVCFYVLAYFIGRKYKGNDTTLQKAVISFGIMVISFTARFGVKILADGTIWYERIAVTYTQYIAAFAIFVIFSFIFKNVKVGKLCKGFCKISFEVYLCHYMFVVGPVSLMHLTSNFVVDIVITTVVVCVVAVVLNLASRMMQKRIEKIG